MKKWECLIAAPSWISLVSHAMWKAGRKLSMLIGLGPWNIWDLNCTSGLHTIFAVWHGMVSLYFWDLSDKPLLRGFGSVRWYALTSLMKVKKALNQDFCGGACLSIGSCHCSYAPNTCHIRCQASNSVFLKPNSCGKWDGTSYNSNKCCDSVLCTALSLTVFSMELSDGVVRAQ